MAAIPLFILAGGGLLLWGVLRAWSPGKPRPFLDGNGRPLAGSLSEKIRVPINGVPQGLFIKGRDPAKPVLLFLHGGPGMPETAWTRVYASVLEDLFVVCWWEQRGSGLSFGRAVPPGTVTVEQLVADTLEVANYLRRRFGREKITLFAHSWGTFIGIRAAAQAPGLFDAYIGMAQISRQLESEKLAYRYMAAEFRRTGDGRMLRRLRKFPIPDMNHVPRAYRPLRDQAMHRLGIGTTRAMRSVVRGIFWPVIRHPEYTLREKAAIWRGKWSAASDRLWDRLIAADVTAEVPRLEVPVYFLHGRHDFTASYALAKDYFGRLEAPLKGFYTFERSAHSPLFEEPDRARRILAEDVLTGANGLADAR